MSPVSPMNQIDHAALQGRSRSRDGRSLRAGARTTVKVAACLLAVAVLFFTLYAYPIVLFVALPCALGLSAKLGKR